MTLELMSRRRHADLIKAAEVTVEGMNSGLAPNAALIKAAKELDLNSKEVALVSHAVNNSATVSHLANTKGNDKAAPFVLTNADEVTQELFPQQDEEQAHNQTEPGKRPSEKDLESPINLDPQAQKKKLAAAQGSYEDTGFYVDDNRDHAGTMKAAFEIDGATALRAGRTVIKVGFQKFSMDRDFAASVAQIRDALDRSATLDCSRLSSNPYIQLRNLKIAVEHARGEYVAARDTAFGSLAKLAEEFRRTDAPSFARVELLAKHAGCDQDTLDVVFTMAALEAVGHKRAGAMKVASHVQLPRTPRENTLVQDCLQLEKMWKRASNCLAAQGEAEIWEKQATEIVGNLVSGKPLVKQADDSKSDFLGSHIREGSKGIADFPAWTVGQKETSTEGDLLGQATGDYSEKEEVKHPLSLAARQRVGNAAGAVNFNSMFDDEFIAGHPMPDVLKAYNKVIAAKPDIDPSTAAALVREQLARGGGIDSDTLIRLKKDYRNKE